MSRSNRAGAVSVTYDTACAVAGKLSAGADGGYVTEVDVVLAEPDTAGVGCAEGAYDTAGTKVAGDISVVDVVFNDVGVVEGLSGELSLLGTPSVTDDTACVLIAGGGNVTEVLAEGELHHSLSGVTYDTAGVVSTVDLAVVYTVGNGGCEVVLNGGSDTCSVVAVAACGDLTVVCAVGDGYIVAL